MNRAPLMAVLVAATGAFAQDTPSPFSVSNVEVHAGAQHVTGNLGEWRELGITAIAEGQGHVVRGEVAAMRRFNADGGWAGVLDTYTLNPDWYLVSGAGVGSGAFFLPRYRVDALLHRKLLSGRPLVIFAGPGYLRSPDGHRERNWTTGLIYYFSTPWVLQAAVRFTESDPGSVRTRQYFGAATYGRDGSDVVTLRLGGGREGYSVIGPRTVLVDFASREGSLQWRHWLDPRSGVALSFEHYHNPTYERNGVSIGWFSKWR
ncbi:MAG TPA: YaiO family outer membrane beta-barrel protein [Usitatibacter sp.]|nr:YaiO family outer membrane beta-barrel protein [Usitatibacter sp.]